MSLRQLFALIAVLAGVFAGNASAAPGFFVGVAEDRPDDFVPGLPAARDLGVKALRVPLLWEPGRTAPDAAQQAELDRLVGAARDMRIVVLIYGRGVDAPVDEAGRNAFCTYARSIVLRHPAIRDVIVWNEPNKPLFWVPQFNPDGSSAAPAAYGSLLARCWDVLHAARPGVNVVGLALSPTGNDNPNAVSNISHSPPNFIHRLGGWYRATGRTARLFDTAAHHPYGSSSAERPWRRHGTTQTSQGDWGRLAEAIQTAFSGTPQPYLGRCTVAGCVWLWYTEIGFQTSPDPDKVSLYSEEENVLVLPDDIGGEPSSPPPDVTTRAPDQATQIRDAIALAACQPFVQAVMNYTLIDSKYLNRWQSGFLWPDLTPKGSYQAFKQSIAAAQGGRVDCDRQKFVRPRAVDTALPRAPGRFRARAGNRIVRLAWTRSDQGDVMGYRLYRAAKVGRRWGRYVRLGGLLTKVSYLDRRVKNGRLYRYRVSSVDTLEQESSPSRTRTVRPAKRR